ncbi:MAG: MOSC domain-containing protein [Gammaproteobacteria bacterium]
MTTVGKVSEIWRFPVKSMGGSRLEAANVDAGGIAGDRAWAMRDELRREVQWGKRFPVLMRCQARYLEEPGDGGVKPVAITFPDGETLTSDDVRIHERLSALTGVEARLWPLQPAADVAFYKRFPQDPEAFMAEVFQREDGEPLPDLSVLPEVLLEHVAVPGTFFDNEAINVMTTASLAHMRVTNPDAAWDVRRFRPNFLLETAPDLAGLVESGWGGRRLRLGEVELELTVPTPRCGMTVQPVEELPFDKTVLRAIVREAAQCLGIGAHCRRAGTVRVGDMVELLD